MNNLTVSKQNLSLAELYSYQRRLASAKWGYLQANACPKRHLLRFTFTRQHIILFVILSKTSHQKMYLYWNVPWSRYHGTQSAFPTRASSARVRRFPLEPLCGARVNTAKCGWVGLKPGDEHQMLVSNTTAVGFTTTKMRIRNRISCQYFWEIRQNSIAAPTFLSLSSKSYQLNK